MTATGVFNPNWRGAEMRAYVQAVSKPKNQFVLDCQEIRDIINDDAQYLIWADAGPDDNKEFAQYALDTLATLRMVGGLMEAVAVVYDPDFQLGVSEMNNQIAEHADWMDAQATREGDRPY